MSTLSGVSLKGEKSKGKIAFQSLKINSLYKGESTEVNQHKSIVTRKNGLQPLGKVIRNVRNPVNLPSEKSESNHESSINLVPIGGAGWGNKQTEKPLVVAGKEVPPTSTPTTLQSSQSGLVTGQQHVLSHTTSVTLTTTRPSHSDGKTWANKITDVPAAPTYLAHRTVQFQQEFPSLTSSGENKNQTNINTPSASTEQRPLLRPQTETSWMQGGSRPQMPQGINIISGSLNQAQSSSGSEIVNGVRSSSGQNGAGGVQVGLNPYIMQYSKNPVMRNMLPTFMVSNQSENMVQPQPKQNSYLSEKVTQHVSPSLSGNDNSLSKSTTDIKELVPPPIIRDEDLKRMNELSKEAGWSIHGEIDYNKKLDFSDDEDQYNEKLNKLSLNGDVKNKSDNSSFYGSSNKHPESNLNVKENIFGSMHINGIPYNSEYMNYYRPPSRQEERQIDDEFEEETVGRTTRAEELTTVLQRAKDRKLEEMKRFEESKLKKYDENHDNKEKELKDEMSKVRSDSSKVKNDDDKEINSKYSSSRLQKQFEHSSDVSNKIQTIPSTIRSLCRADSDMSSSGYSEYRSDSWIDDDHSNKSSSLKRDKRPEYDRFRKEKSRLDKDKSDRYAHNDYSRVDDNRKGYDHKRDFKRTENMNVSSKNEDMYDIDRNNKKESFSKVQKYHSRDSMETPEEIEKENLNVDDDSYSWSQKSLGKEYYKDDINSTGYNKMHIPGPITQEKFEACELTSEPKRNLTQLVKSERKDGKKNDQAEETNIKSKIGVWDLAPTNKSKIVHDQKFEHDSKSSKNNLKHEDETKTTEPKSSLENSSGLFFALSHHKGMRSDRNIGGSRSFHQNINSRTVSRSGSNRKSTWAESYDDNQRPRGPSRRDDRNRGEDRIRTDDRNRGDERNRNDDRNRGNNRQQNDRYSEKSALRGYGQRNDQRGRGRLSNTDSRTINGRNSQKNSDETNDKINKSNQNISSNRSKTSSKPQSKLDLYGDSSRRSNESRYNSKQSSRSFNSQKQEDIWESVSEPSDYENQQKNNSNRRQNSRTYLASSTRGEKRSSYDKKDPSKDSSNNEKLCQKSSLSTNDLKSFGDNRTNKKDESRKSSSEVLKNRVSNQNNRKDQSKSSSSRPNQSSNNTKAGQTNQRYERQKSQSQFVVDDSNTSIIKDAVIMVNNNPPPPPQTNAWDKPITHALRAQSPNVNKTVNQSNNRANSLTDIQENPSQNIQRLVLNKDKISPNVMENGIIDTTQRMETIIFENTTYKSKPCGESKNKYSSNIKREKESCNFNEEQDTCFRAFKTSNCDSKDAKINEAVQMSMTFKNDESSDLNLGFGDFESDFSRSGGHLSTENKDSVMSMTSHSRSMHTGPSSLAASDLKTMIAGTKKVWDDKPESNQQNSAESAFNTVYSTANTGQHDKSDMSVIDEQRVHNQQVYRYVLCPAPQLQNVSGSFIPVSMAAASGQLKQDPNSATTNVCKVKPQPQGTISPPLNQQQSSASTHAFSSSTTPQPHTSTTPLANTIPTQAAHMNLQIMMENNDGLPDIYSTHMMKQQQTHLILNTNNKAGVEMLAKQFVSAAPGPSPSSAMIFNSTQQHLIPPPSPSAPQVYQTMLEPTQTVINNATRSQFNQFTYGLQSNGLNQNSQFNPSMFIHTNTPGGQGGSEVFQSSISPFRLGPPYNNGQQINTNINPVLIPSSTNSSTSQVKPTSQQIGAIGNKTTYNASTPSSYMVQYDPNTMFNQPYNSMNSARATPLQSSSSLYSTNSATGPTNAGFIPNVASAFQAQVVAGASANSFGIPNAFGSPQNAAPNMQNYTSQYRQVPYLKGNLSSGSGNNDLQKSGVSNQQDIGNAMFSSNIFRQQFFDTNKPLMNSNQQTHQSMQGKYNNYQVSTSQNSQLPLMQQPRMNLNNSNNGSIAANIAPQYPSPIQRPVSTFPHLQRMPPPQNMRIQPNVPIQHFMNKSQSSNNYYVSNTGLIVEPQLPIASKIDNANSNVDSKAEEKIDNISKPKNTECKDDKQLVANE